jgi:hypothetical protein
MKIRMKIISGQKCVFNRILLMAKSQLVPPIEDKKIVRWIRLPSYCDIVTK